MRLLRVLVGSPPQTAKELAKALRVTRTAVTEQLQVLDAAGYVERRVERLPGRGRPPSRYVATRDALLLLAGKYPRQLVPAIWEAVSQIGGSELKCLVLKQVSRKVADYYKRRIPGETVEERLSQLADLLREEGDLVVVEKGRDGQLVFTRRSCPFIRMFDETRTVCSLDEEILHQVLGVRVRRRMSRHDGDPCCRFMLAPRRAKPA
jgi:predicted ArsR family transcriptional regulator